MLRRRLLQLALAALVITAGGMAPARADRNTVAQVSGGGSAYAVVSGQPQTFYRFTINAQGQADGTATGHLSLRYPAAAYEVTLDCMAVTGPDQVTVSGLVTGVSRTEDETAIGFRVFLTLRADGNGNSNPDHVSFPAFAPIPAFDCADLPNFVQPTVFTVQGNVNVR